MDSDQNKNQSMVTATANPADGIIVKDVDGTFKVLSDGELKDLNSLLKTTEITVPATETVPPSLMLDVPKFTDLAVVPAETHFMEPEPAGKPNEKKDLHFHPDDKEELNRELEKLVSVYGVLPQKRYSVNKIAQKLIEKDGLVLDQVAEQAFTKALLTFFRQIRSAVDLKTILMGSTSEHGLDCQVLRQGHSLA